MIRGLRRLPVKFVKQGTDVPGVLAEVSLADTRRGADVHH
jgi:hypothetical protein